MNTAEIAKLEEELAQAMQSGDIPVLERLLHPVLLFVIPSGDTIDRETDLDHFRSGQVRFTTLESREQQIHIIGNCAVVSVVLDLKGFFYESPIDGTYKYTRTWQKGENGWQVISGAGMSLEEPEEE